MTLLRKKLDHLSKADLSLSNIAKLQQSDPDLRLILVYLHHDKLPMSHKTACKIILEVIDYLVVDNTLFHSRVAKAKRTKSLNKYQIVIPQTLT
jgi:hypothetical protein